MTVPTLLPDRPFTRSEAMSLGLTRDELADLVACRSLRRMLRNVYVRGDVEDTVELRAAAASRVVTPGVVFVDRTAAWLHGVNVFDYREHEIAPPLEGVVLRDKARIERPECMGGERDLAPGDVMPVLGLQVTTPLRTALDLGCVLRDLTHWRRSTVSPASTGSAGRCSRRRCPATDGGAVS